MKEIQSKLDDIQTMLNGLYDGGDVTEAARSSLQYTLNEAQKVVKNITYEPLLAAGYSYKTAEFQLMPNEETNELRIIARNSKKRLYIKPNSDNSCTLVACR